MVHYFDKNCDDLLTLIFYLKDTFTDDLLVPVFQAVLQEAKVAPADVQDICVGQYFYED